MKNALIILFILCMRFSFANTIIAGRGHAINSLQKAISQAKDGDTILLQQGVYKEGNIIINKAVSLIGIDTPVLDGESRYEILTVTGKGILIRGLRFRNAGYSSMNDYAAISLIDASHCTIENNIIEHAYFAIHVANSGSCTISDNTIKGIPKTEQTSGNGIHLWKCDSMVVKNNNITGQRDGIYFEFVTNSTILRNRSYQNIRYGLHFMFSNYNTYVENMFKENGSGVAVMFSHHVLMLNNVFEHNWGSNAYGLLLKEISDATILKNKFIRNTSAIFMEGTNRIELKLNSFQGSGWALRIQANCDGNTISNNNFEGNTFDIATNGTMILNRFYKNYWDKYEGYDINKDGKGDAPYHPLSMYSMAVEQNPNSILLLRSFMVSLLDKAEKAIPSFTPENLVDNQPLMRRIPL